MVKFPEHAKKQMAARGIEKFDVLSAIKNYPVIFEEKNGGFGTKYYSKLPGIGRDLIVIWFWNKKGEEEIITAYWRRKKWEK